MNDTKIKKDRCEQKANLVSNREILLGYIALVVGLIYTAFSYIDWDSFEKWAWVIAVVSSLTLFLYREKITIIKTLITNRKSSILNDMYVKNSINIAEYERLQQEIEELIV